MNCTACPLYKNATQTVFGAGSAPAQMMVVGEQPGNEEDLKGKPFVGPAGKVLDKALQQTGISRREIYITNAVKHFKWTPSDRPQKPRLHKKPNSREIKACHPWLEAEVAIVKPNIIVAMGSTAAQACVGKAIGINKLRQQVLHHEKFHWQVVVTWHPSAILRAIDKVSREKMFEQLVEDLKFARKTIRDISQSNFKCRQYSRYS